MALNPRATLLFFSTLLALGSALCPYAHAMKRIPGDLLFRVSVPGPTQARLCFGSLWIHALQGNLLLRVNSTSGVVESQTSVKDLGISDKLTAIGCGPNGLLLGSTESLHALKLKSDGSPLMTAPIKIPGTGHIRDIHCSGSICFVVRDELWISLPVGEWTRIPLHPSSEVRPLIRPDEADPFTHWRDQYIIATGKYFRILPFHSGTEQLRAILDPLRSSVVISGGRQPYKWGNWGVWEGSLMSPKGIATAGLKAFAISDVGTKLVSFFTHDGIYLGALSSGVEFKRFSYPIDLDSTNNLLFVTDFKDNSVSAFRVPEVLGPDYRAREIPEELARENLFRHPSVLSEGSEGRCLGCHDGLAVHSLEKFLKDKHGHPIDVEVRVKTNLPLEDGNRMTCGTCHEPHHIPKSGRVATAAGDFHLLKKAPGMLRMDQNELCLSCHLDHAKRDQNHFGLEHRGWALAPLVRVRACSQCHSAHGGERHLTLAPSPQLCLGCHGTHQTPKNHPMDERVNCLSCHSPHGAKKKLTFARGSVHSEGQTCLGCHKAIRTDNALHPNSHLTKMVPKNRSRWHPEESSCLECHAPHVAKKPEVTLCLSCHATKHRQHGPLITIAETERAKGIHLVNERITCLTCHVPHGEPREAAPILKFCASCHGQKTPNLYQKFHLRLEKKVKSP